LSITLSTNNSHVRRLTPADEDFCIISGYAYYPRAVIEIDKSCPADVQKIVQLAISKGWISAEAWIKDSEYMWEKLNDNAS
jgi:hypothetical protein